MTTVDLVLENQFANDAEGHVRLAGRVFEIALDLAAVDAAGLVDFVDGQLGALFGKLAIGREGTGHDVDKSQLDRFFGRGRR